MSVVLRCPECGADVVVRRRRGASTGRCPKCRAAVSAPANFDFFEPEMREATDEDTATILGPLLLFGGVCCCVPATAYVWWRASGAIGEARQDGRPPPAMLVRLRAVAAVLTLAQAAALAAWAAASR